jgi:ABC-type uncharacterized transport system substrate-binding protein
MKIFSAFITAIGVILLSLCPLYVAAHPHVFLHTGLQILFDEKGLSGVRVIWMFDEMFSNMIISEFDSNANGRFEPAEIDNLKEGAFSYLQNFDYFTHIKIDGNPFEVKFVRDFTAKIKGHTLVYQFLVPCHVSAIDAVKEVKLSIYDHSYYCSVFLAKEAIAYQNHQSYEVEHRIERNRKDAYYYGQIFPEEITVRFKRKHG